MRTYQLIDTSNLTLPLGGFSAGLGSAERGCESPKRYLSCSNIHCYLISTATCAAEDRQRKG